MALEGNVHDASRALELGIATGIGAIGPGIGVGFIFGKTIEAVVFYGLLGSILAFVLV